MRHMKLGIAAGLVLTALAPAAASADTVKIGSTLSHPNTPSLCTNCVGVQHGASSGLSTFPFTSPANGIVTGWAVRTGDTGAVYGLRILRPGAGNFYASVGASVLAPAIISATDITYNFPTSLAIKKGDAIGVQTDAAHSLPQFTTTNNADVLNYAVNFPDNTSTTFTDIGGLHELLVQATVKFCNVPSLTGLKLADAQSKLAAADCAASVTKKKLKKTKKNKKKKGKVISQVLAPGTTGAPGTVVAIKVAKLKKR
jgi:hypothetical protein